MLKFMLNFKILRKSEFYIKMYKCINIFYDDGHTYTLSDLDSLPLKLLEKQKRDSAALIFVAKEGLSFSVNIKVKKKGRKERKKKGERHEKDKSVFCTFVVLSKMYSCSARRDAKLPSVVICSIFSE